MSLEFSAVSGSGLWTVFIVVLRRRSRYLQVNFPLDLEMLVQAKRTPRHVSHASGLWNIVWGRFTAASA